MPAVHCMIWKQFESRSVFKWGTLHSASRGARCPFVHHVHRHPLLTPDTRRERSPVFPVSVTRGQVGVTCTNTQISRLWACDCCAAFACFQLTFLAPPPYFMSLLCSFLQIAYIFLVVKDIKYEELFNGMLPSPFHVAYDIHTHPCYNHVLFLSRSVSCTLCLNAYWID